jgi:CRISPR-associated protein Csb2
MLAIAFRFPGGRYHATPWGRHVNEADVAWPPEPWRLVRALLAVWHRRLAPQPGDAAELRGLLSALAGEAPHYRLPPAVHSHARHYMRIRAGSGEKPTLVFDAFLRLDSTEDLVVLWPGVELAQADALLLDKLLEQLPYLGRAESWVDARRLADWDGEVNCGPAGDDGPAGACAEPVEMLLPETPAAYAARRDDLLAQGLPKKRSERAAIMATLPEDWLDALAVETSALQAAAWSDPPAARRLLYARPRPDLSAVRPRTTTTGVPVRTLRFALYGRPLPRVEDTLRLGELARRAAIGRVGRFLGEDRVPALVSGHELASGPAHLHAFFLPEDADGDGRIDHLTLHAPTGFEGAALPALESLTRLWTREGSEWRLLFEGRSTATHAASPLEGPARRWVSATPWLRPWHAKRGFGDLEQLRRECRSRDLPEPSSCEVLAERTVAGRPLRPVQFARFRSRRGLHQPDRQGRFLRLEFAEALSGPLALGFGCHFGLGLFLPEA